MAPKNITFNEFDDESYDIVDQYIFGSRFYGYEDSYNSYDIDNNDILPYKESNNEHVIRYNDVTGMKITPLQLKIKNFFGEIETFTNSDTVTFIYNDDKELFKKYREIWNRITELIGINNTPDFVRTNFYDDEFIIADVHENTSFAEGNCRNELVIALHSVINNYLQTSLTQIKNIDAYKYT